MTSVGKERAAVVTITALLLWGRSDLPSVTAAIVAVAFFWWFIGRCAQQRRDDSLPAASDGDR